MTSIAIPAMNLTLTKVVSILDGKDFSETVDVRILNRLLNSSLLRIDKGGWNGADHENEKSQLTAYRNKLKKGIIKVKYSITKSGFGRVSPWRSLSLGSFRKEVRHTLAKDHYIDIDIKNCHPVLLEQVMNKNGITTPFLSRYVHHRSDLLTDYSTAFRCSQDEVKELFIRLMYYGSFAKWATDCMLSNAEPDDFIHGFIREMKMLAQTIKGHNEEMVKALKDFKKTEKRPYENEDGRVCSYFCQEYERRILESIYSILKLQGRVGDDSVLCFDGLMMPKSTFSIDLLTTIEQEVEKRTGFKITLVVKEMDKDLIAELEAEEAEKVEAEALADSADFEESKLVYFDSLYLDSLTTYKQKKNYFERFVCKILQPTPFFAFLQQERTEYTEEEAQKVKPKSYVLYSQDQLQIAFRHLRNTETDTRGAEKDCSFISKWLDDRHIKCLGKMDFLPANQIGFVENPYFFNSFAGWDPIVQSAFDKDKVEKYLAPWHLIGLNMCGGVQSNYDYLLDTVAKIFLYPTQRDPIATIIHGRQGTGKNRWLQAVCNLLHSSNWISSSRPSDFFGDHAEGFHHKLIINMNEAEGNYDLEALFKTAVSEDTLRLNPKNIRPFDIKNYSRMFFFSNKMNPIPIDVKSGDRRYVVFKSTEVMLNNEEYGPPFWTAFSALIKKPEFLASLFYYLTVIRKPSVDTRNFTDRPITEAYLEMCRQYIPAEALFFEHFIQQSYFDPRSAVDAESLPPFSENKLFNSDFKMSRPDFYIEYTRWCKEHGYNQQYQTTSSRMMAKIRELDIPMKECSLHNHQNGVSFIPSEVYQHLASRRLLISCSVVLDEETEKKPTGRAVSSLFSF
jgi:hypothetical protein